MVKKHPNPSVDPTSLGSILVNSGTVEAKQLEAALQFQSDNVDLLLGEALVRIGAISREILEAALTQQEVVRNGVSRKTNAQVHRILKMATQQTIAIGGTGGGLVQALQNLAAKMGGEK